VRGCGPRDAISGFFGVSLSALFDLVVVIVVVFLVFSLRQALNSAHPPTPQKNSDTKNNNNNRPLGPRLGHSGLGLDGLLVRR